MRNLTLNERINLRAILSRYGVPRETLLSLKTARQALFHWNLCLGYFPITRMSEVL